MSSAHGQGHPVDSLLRWRLLRSAVRLVAAVGFEATTAEMIAAAAGVSSDEFHRHFPGKSDCCREAFEAICNRFDRRLLPVYRSSAPWPARMRGAAYAAVDYCREHETEVRFGLQVRCQYGRSPRTEASLRLHLAEIDSARQEVTGRRRVPSAGAEVCLGAFLEVVVRLGSEDRLGELPGAVPALLHNAYSIYLGPEAAARELQAQETPAPRGMLSLKHPRF